MSALTGFWKKLIPTFMEELERFKTSVMAVAADFMRFQRIWLHVEPDDVTELLQPHGQTRTDEELLLVEKQRQQFLKMESTPGEDPVEIVEMTIKDLEYCINLTDKRAEDLRGLTPVLKYYQTALHATEMHSTAVHCKHNFYMQWKTKYNYVIHFIAVLALLPWSGTKPKISLRCDCSCLWQVGVYGDWARNINVKNSHCVFRQCDYINYSKL